ncbi:protein FAM13A isoform X2 [Macrobrachium rosenbergii]|uniref:protein FAM13A isoform X2 n=1 Tax=Macrobrachium rosenbergii TaxID=79674 RepID=UPI0034D611A5
MRRPSFCCDQHGEGGEGDPKCQPQEEAESTLARVRRFLAVSMGARPATRTPTRCKHHALPPDPLHAPAHAVHSLLADMKNAGVGVQGVLGRPLEEVMAAHGEDSNGHGVPTLVHLLCCFLLTHGVDYDTLVSEDWCDEEVRTRLLLERGASGVAPDAQEAPPGSESAVATGLLRLFLDELPHALLPSDVAPRLLLLAAESGIGENDDDRRSGVCTDVDVGSVGISGVGESEGETRGGVGLCVAVVPKLRRLLHRRLPIHNLCLLRYLTAFIHQLRTSNHNTCPVPVDSLSRVLGRVLIKEDAQGERDSANRLGELLILCYGDIFQSNSDILDDDQDDYSDSVSSPGSGVDSREDGVIDEAYDDEEDDPDTTTTDTDDFRSPPVSPLKVARPRGPQGMRGGLLPLNLQPPPVTTRLTEVGNGSSPNNGNGRSGKALGKSNLYGGSSAWTSPSTIPGGGAADKPRVTSLPLDLASPVTPDPAAPVTRAPEPRDPADVLGSPTSGVNSDSATDAANRNGEQDARRTPEKDSILTASHLPPSVPHSAHRKRKEHADGKEGGEHDPKVIRSTKEVVGDLDSIRPKMPAYNKDFLSSPADSLESPDDDFPSLLDDDDEPATQDGGMRCQSSEEEERAPSYLSSLTSEDDEPTRYDPVPTDVTPCQPLPMSIKTPQEPSLVLSELLDANEPVTSDRGSWGLRGDKSHCDTLHRTAPRYSRFDDESPIQSSWYRSSDDDVMLSPRSSHAFIDTTGAPPGPGDHSPPPGQSAVKILMKNINSIKKKIKRYEEEFEAAFGYRPSHSEKMKDKNIKKSMSELSKARKELKQMKDDVAGLMTVPTVFPLSLLRCQEATNPSARTTAPTSCTADTIRQVEDRLREKRTAVGRPSELKNMNTTEMQEEKTALQKALLYYESVHGRPITREDRDLARPLYDRYRQVKRIVMRTGSRTKENLVELAPILEHEAMDFTLASPQHRGSLQDENEKPVSLPPSPPTTPPVFDTSPVFDSPRSTPTPSDDPKTGRALGDLHALPLSELRERKKEAREEKKKLRRALREFEENFEREMGRKVQKEDRGPMEQTYLDYKHAKAKLRLLEALLSKHEPQKV